MFVLDMLVHVGMSDQLVAFDIALQRAFESTMNASGFVGPNKGRFCGEIALFVFARIVDVVDDLGEGEILSFYRRAFAGRALFDLWQAVGTNAVSRFALENRWQHVFKAYLKKKLKRKW